MTTYEMFGRAKKVGQLVAVLRQAGVTAEMARQSDEAGWQMATNAASYKKSPSETTRAMVIAKLEELAASRRKGGPTQPTHCQSGGAAPTESDEPECDCHQIAVDEFDASGCPVHDAGPKCGDNIGDVNAPPAITEEVPF